MTDLRPFLEALAPEACLSTMARGLVPSPILEISYEVRARIAAGASVVQFTVGDFDPAHFRVPAALEGFLHEAVDAHATNYPPADGERSLRESIRDHYRAHLGLDYPIDGVLVSSGARPALYGAYRCLLDPGEVVVSPVPGWNNGNFAQLVGARHVAVPTRPEDDFLPTAEALRPHLSEARLLVLCSPVNPTGTMFEATALRDISRLVLEENRRRERVGARRLYLVYDQVYRLLAFGDRPHLTPVGLEPEMARYTLFVDAISKGFAATGLRVGWLVGPPYVVERMRALMTHVGAWAPKPEQLATARLLARDDLLAAYAGPFNEALRARLDRLYQAVVAWKREGLPVDAIPPQGAMYLSVRFDLEGRPGLPDEGAVRRFLLDAGCAIIPFSAFGDTHNRGWVRFSVGAVGLAEIDACLPRLHQALRRFA